MTTTRKLLHSVDGRQLPSLGEVAVYWPAPDYTDIFSTEGFDADAYLASLNSEETPELIEHDAEATAKWLLAQMVAITQFPIGYMYEEVRNAARNAVTKVTGGQP